MRRENRRRTILSVAAVLAAAAAAPDPCLAQAWLPPTGEASYSFGFQNLHARYHLLWEGQRDDRGIMEWNHLISDLSYGVTDRIALRVGMPYVFSKYTGAFPHRPVGRPVYDDGTWHSTFQDFRLEARYMATTGSLVVTPFVAAVLPSTDYEQHSHVAAGRHLREYTAGVNLGRPLDPILPDTYAHAQLSFTMPQRVRGIWHNRNNANLELGHFVSPSVAVRALGSWQWTHGGFRIPLDARRAEYSAVHDQLAKDSHFILGAGVSFAASGSLDLSATAFKTISGENSIESRGIGVGATWSFSPKQILRKKKRPSPQVRPGIS